MPGLTCGDLVGWHWPQVVASDCLVYPMCTGSRPETAAAIAGRMMYGKRPPPGRAWGVEVAVQDAEALHHHEDADWRTVGRDVREHGVTL